MPRRNRFVSMMMYCVALGLLVLLAITRLRGDLSDPEASAVGGRASSGPKKAHTVTRPINPHDFHMIMNNPKICTDMKEMNLLVLVSSAVPNFYRRQAIRETWGGSTALEGFNAKLVFLLGNPHDSSIQPQVVEEYRTHGDVLQEDFLDSYLNLTLKTVMGLKWAWRHCPQARFVLKTDDDMYVNVPLLLGMLQEQGSTRYITGCIKQRKSFRPVNLPAGMPLPPGHPAFAAGAGYVLTGDLLRELYMASLSIRTIPVEDVYVTAHLAQSVGVHPPRHDPRFSCGEMVNEDCDLAQAFTGHKVNPERMYQIWEKLNPNGVASPCFDF
ncbi:beta-1,3-galactosyltransferase 1-like [Oratosquilla oratoria]|uniref:beta-1,3-galactosyltransferase 1-like n=1 Tax=Oratosquilla oratoria TaxID=337810 RepID=UPI003F75BD31